MTDAVLGQLLLAFSGTELPPPVAERLARRPAAGVTLFRHHNVAHPAQVRELTDAIQRHASPERPFLVAIDQEGGQLLGLGDASTPFAGNMALGATDDPQLAERVGEAIGTELRAAGINLDYAPVCDLATNPANPSLGVRSFGDDPARAAPLVAGFVRGLARAGVAATLKHFPGKGDVAVDTHLTGGEIAVDAARFEAVELVPFRAGIEAGAAAIMTSHAAAPALSGDALLPSTLSPAILGPLLRERLGFEGLAISDAMDMRALAQGAGRVVEAIAGLRAGLDLLLLSAAWGLVPELEDGLVLATDRGLLDPASTVRSLGRIDRLRASLAAADPPELSAIGSAAHRAIADELACRAVTLVRDVDGRLPLRLPAEASILVVMPRPADLTPADTSSTVSPGLAAAVWRHHPRVLEVVTAHAPTDAEIAAAAAGARDHDLVLAGTVSASFEARQVRLVEALLGSGTPVVTAALRTPWDLVAYPEATVHACTYSVLQPSLDALADALFGRIPFAGRLPVKVES